MTIAYDPAVAQTLQVLALAERQLAAASDRLGVAASHTASATDETNWQTDAAARFHAAAEVWRNEVNALSVNVEASRDDLRRARTRIETAQLHSSPFDSAPWSGGA